MKKLVKNSKTGQFLINKCASSDAWAWGVTLTGILAMVGVTLL